MATLSSEWKSRTFDDSTNRDSDIMRLEIRKGKFLFKFAVAGKTKILPKVFQQEKYKISSRGTSLDGYSIGKRNSEADPEGTENDFPPIQVCRSHGNTWRTSVADKDHREDGDATIATEAFKQSDSDGSEVNEDSDLTERTKCSLKQKHNQEKIGEEGVTLETLDSDHLISDEKPDSDHLISDEKPEVGNLVTHTDYEPPGEEIFRENEHFVDTDFVRSEEEMEAESPCEYTYILDIEDFPCDTSSFASQAQASHDPDKTENTHRYLQGDMDYSTYSDSVHGTDVTLSHSNQEPFNAEGIPNKTGDVDRDDKTWSAIAESEGEATETEFDPLEGDEWEGMETPDVTSCHRDEEVEKSPDHVDEDSTDSENSSSDFEDLIGQYVTFMPREISRSVNSERRAAAKPRSSVSYRRYSSELKRYFCEKCGISYQSNTAYQAHKKTHQTNTCEVCFKQFKNSKGLLRHSNIHTGENLSTCSFCKMTFNYAKSLYRHIQRQHLSHLSLKKVTKIMNINKVDTRLKLRKFTIPKVKDKDENSEDQRRLKTLNITQNKQKETPNFTDKDRSKNEKTLDREREIKDKKTRGETQKKNRLTDKVKEKEDEKIERKGDRYRAMKRNSVKEREKHRRSTLETEEHESKRRRDLEKMSRKTKPEKGTKILTEREKEEKMTNKEELKAKEGIEKTDINSVKDNGRLHKLGDTEKRQDLGLKECRVCIKKFEPRILERHMRSHTGERPFLCDQCPFRCSQLGNLNKHRAVVHRKSDKRVLAHKCDTCNKRFYDVAHLKRHALTHYEKSVKHYACLVCKKKFRFDSGLQRHMQLHREGLKIRCGICDRRFYDSSGLNNHLKQHTYDLPYRCEICRISFKSSHAIRRHNVIHERRGKSPQEFRTS